MRYIILMFRIFYFILAILIRPLMLMYLLGDWLDEQDTSIWDTWLDVILWRA